MMIFVPLRDEQAVTKSCTGTVLELVGGDACATKRRTLIIRKSSGSESDSIGLNQAFAFFYFFPMPCSIGELNQIKPN